jgi:hypothetical protein
MSVQYFVKEAGKKRGVFLSLDEYEKLPERAEGAEALEMLRALIYLIVVNVSRAFRFRRLPANFLYSRM